MQADYMSCKQGIGMFKLTSTVSIASFEGIACKTLQQGQANKMWKHYRDVEVSHRNSFSPLHIRKYLQEFILISSS